MIELKKIFVDFISGTNYLSTNVIDTLRVLIGIFMIYYLNKRKDLGKNRGYPMFLAILLVLYGLIPKT